jgi:hypothetical protein
MEKDLTTKEGLLEYLKIVETAGMTRTGDWASMWQTSIRYYFSDQLEGQKVHKDWDWVVLNYIWPAHIAEIAKLTRNAHTIVAEPWEDSDSEAAEAWQALLQWLWTKGLNGRGMRREQMQTILDQQLFGYSVTKTFWQDKDEWDVEQQAFIGNVKTRLWHPAEFWATDDERIDDGDCGTERVIDLEEAIKLFPDHKKELEEEADKFVDGPSESSFTSIRGQLSSTGTYPGEGKGGIDPGTKRVGAGMLLNLILRSDKLNKPNDDTKQKASVKLVKINETFISDPLEKSRETEESIPPEELIARGQIIKQGGIFLDAETGQPIEPEDFPTRTTGTEKIPVYPRGRVILHVGDVILSDEPYKYSRWPFVITPHYLLPHMWQGIDAVQLYKSTQDMINVSTSHLFNNMKQYGDRKVMIEEGAIRAPKGKDKAMYRIGKGAGSVIRVALGAIKGQRIKFVEPSQIPPAATQLYSLFAQEFKNIQGLQSIAKGEKQPGKMTAAESNILAISSNDRIQLQSVFQDEWIRETASLLAEIIKDKYEPGRWVRITGEDNSLGIQQITEGLKNTKFDVDILPALTLPFDKEKRQQSYLTANQIVTQPIASPMTDILLRELEIPGWKKILKRYESWTQFLAFNQLIEAVKSGETDPRSALQQLIKRFEAEVLPAIEQRVNEQGFQQKVNQGNIPGKAG